MVEERTSSGWPGGDPLESVGVAHVDLVESLCLGQAAREEREGGKGREKTGEREGGGGGDARRERSERGGREGSKRT